MAFLLLAAASLLLRALYLGNPLIDVDEEFYLLTGDRLLHGVLPYVGIWDRKPVGLFLLYAAIRLLGGVGIIQYQIVAGLFAAGTAVLIALISRRFASPRAAIIAGFVYVPALAMNGGAGGQTPVFYNLLMAMAALIVLRLWTDAAGARTIRLHGMAAMLLVGLSIQIKPTVVFEGIYFGLSLVWLAWCENRNWRRVSLDAALWIAMALLPSALCFLWYAAMGHADAFAYANLISVGLRQSEPVNEQLTDLSRILLRLSPFLVALLIGRWLLGDHLAVSIRSRSAEHANVFLLGWLAAAAIGFALFGTYFNHYALPLLVPLAICTAPTLDLAHRRAGAVMTIVLLLAMLIPYPLDWRKQVRRHGDARTVAAMVDQIAPRLHGGCLFVFYGEPILYHLTGSCLPTRWVFPFHLSLAREAPALGVDPLQEVERIMASRPTVVVDRINDDPAINLPVQKLVRATLQRDYRLVYAAAHSGKNTDIDQVWALKINPPARLPSRPSA